MGSSGVGKDTNAGGSGAGSGIIRKACLVRKSARMAISRVMTCFRTDGGTCPRSMVQGNKTTAVESFYRVCCRRTITRKVGTRITFMRTVGRAN